MSTNNNLVSGFDDDKDDSLKISLEKLEQVEKGILLYLYGYIELKLFSKTCSTGYRCRV